MNGQPLKSGSRKTTGDCYELWSLYDLHTMSGQALMIDARDATHIFVEFGAKQQESQESRL